MSHQVHPQFYPTQKHVCSGTLDEINALPSERYLQRLMLQWVRHERVLTFASMSEQGVGQPVLIALEDKGETVALARMSRDEFRRFSPKYAPLPEDVHTFADKAGYSPDVEWFERRNARLRIADSDEFDSFIVPASSIAELVVSYMMSSAGRVSISSEMTENRNYIVTHAYRMHLHFYGDESGRGWFESHLVLKRRLESLVGKLQVKQQPSAAEIRV